MRRDPTPPGPAAGRRHSVNTRLAALALIIYARGRVTADTLAADLDVTPRTIYRDIARLQQIGVPIATTPGPGGGFKFDDTSGTTAAGGDGLLDLLTRSGVLTSAAPSDATLEAILGRIGEELDPDDRRTITAASERILFDPEEWYTRDRPSEDFYRLRDAVIHDRQLLLTYTERDGTIIHNDTFDPYGLIWKGGVWYLYGGGHTTGELRRIRVNRIGTAATTGATFTRPPDFDLLASWKQHLEQFGKGHTRVVLHIAADAVSEFENFGWKRDTKITRHTDHWVAELHVDSTGWLVPLVLSYAGTVTVIEPHQLRAQIVATATAILAGHDPDTPPVAPHPPTHGDVHERDFAGEFVGGV